MPKRTDIKKVMVIGSGPIVIGQAAEFDYAGTQACLALKEEGYQVILVNSNPATIMTDTHIADKVYMEPLTLEYVAKIIRYERPDAIVPGLGGQTGLNLAVQLAKKGILEECGVEILGTSFESIEQAEDRELFKELCISLGEPVLPSEVVNTVEEGVEVLVRALTVLDPVEDDMYVPSVFRSDLNVPHPEELVVSFAVFFPDVVGKVLEHLLCGLHVFRPLLCAECERTDKIVLVEILLNHPSGFPLLPALVVLLDPLRARLFLRAPKPVRSRTFR